MPRMGHFKRYRDRRKYVGRCSITNEIKPTGSNEFWFVF